MRGLRLDNLVLDGLRLGHFFDGSFDRLVVVGTRTRLLSLNDIRSTLRDRHRCRNGVVFGPRHSRGGRSLGVVETPLAEGDVHAKTRADFEQQGDEQCHRHLDVVDLDIGKERRCKLSQNLGLRIGFRQRRRPFHFSYASFDVCDLRVARGPCFCSSGFGFEVVEGLAVLLFGL